MNLRLYQAEGEYREMTLRPHGKGSAISFPYQKVSVCGQDTLVPLIDGGMSRYINLDNAASTPAFLSVQEKVNEFLEIYSSVHRGAGFKSQLSSFLMEQAREIVADFFGANPQTDTTIFVKNTTEAINMLAHRLELSPGDVILTTVMEHHSNDLPWRDLAKVEYVDILPDGTLDLHSLQQKIRHFAGSLRLVAITGASNVTGMILPIHKIAEWAHAAGSQIFVDCAQLAPHRPIDMHPGPREKNLDYIAISGHKMYAPFGTGVLIGSKDTFLKGEPDYKGGGTIELVTLDEVHWAEPPFRDEAGSPNVVGIIALAASLEVLKMVGMETAARREHELTNYALERLGSIDRVTLFGPSHPVSYDERVGVISFEVAGIPHGKIAAILSFEGAIGVRNGCFCAHPYVLKLKKVQPEDIERYKNNILRGDHSRLPGLVRASMGIYNQEQDIDLLVQQLQKIVNGEVRGEYVLNPVTGEYFPKDFDPEEYQRYFSFYPIMTHTVGF